MSREMPGDALLVFSNLPDRASAERLARAIVDRRLGACVNIHPPCRSIYRWEGSIEDAEELPITVKTSRAGYAALEACIRELHPYDVPEIIAVPVACGLPAYLDWVAAETTQPVST